MSFSDTTFNIEHSTLERSNKAEASWHRSLTVRVFNVECSMFPEITPS